jgi:hypothetical protein
MPIASLAARKTAMMLLLLQPIPLLLLPPESFGAKSQEWWLPALLAVLVLLAGGELLVRRSHAVWPWHLMIFAQGFNIISRIMMVWAHATRFVGGVMVFNLPYLVLTALAISWSGFLLWYLELPAVRRCIILE